MNYDKWKDRYSDRIESEGPLYLRYEADRLCLQFLALNDAAALSSRVAPTEMALVVPVAHAVLRYRREREREDEEAARRRRALQQRNDRIITATILEEPGDADALAAPSPVPREP